MIGEGVSSVWIGCSTDAKYSQLTSVMLSSLDDNARIPEATIIVADFGLTSADRTMLRDAAGQLGERMYFHPVTPDSREIVALPAFDFPFPLMGRFVVPQLVTQPRARLILLDSDMVVNRSLRPLFETNMRGFAVAAVHDAISWREHYGRAASTHYFNAGMMMIDVDLYRQQDISGQAMRRLASYGFPPMWLDQDALNDVIGDRWLTLDRRWNFFHAADYRGFTREDYEAADIVHFSGPKPWEQPDHPAAPIYHLHAARAERKVLWRAPDAAGGSNRVFITACYELLLGRQLETAAVLREREPLSPAQSVGCIIGSPEFKMAVIDPLAQGNDLPMDRFPGRPSLAQRYWAIDRLPILAGTAVRVEQAKTWSELLCPLLEDRHFMSLGQLQPVKLLQKNEEIVLTRAGRSASESERSAVWAGHRPDGLRQ